MPRLRDSNFSVYVKKDLHFKEKIREQAFCEELDNLNNMKDNIINKRETIFAKKTGKAKRSKNSNFLAKFKEKQKGNEYSTELVYKRQIAKLSEQSTIIERPDKIIDLRE